ncbi:MAG: condensation domain-containing protein, partial [Chloroflexota bacterium]|nr:condensation domain-containing protein [Chloroflexota bacterium]
STLLPTALLEALKWLSQDENATLYMTLLAAFQTLLHRYTGRDDLLIGSPIAGRTRVETEGLIGLFVNTLVLRGDLSGAPSFRELLARTRATTLAAYDHQEVPFEQIVTKLQPPRDRGRNPLVQVLFALQNAPRAALQLAGLTLESLNVETGTAKFDLSLSITETPEGLRAAFEYNSDLFDAPTIERMVGHFHTLLEGVIADPDRTISALPLLTDTERRQLLVDWNDTRTDYPRDACIHELFAEQAARTPDAIAIVYEDDELTYRELDKRALLARLLRERSRQPHQVPLSFAQEQMWVLDHLAPDSPRYNVTQAFRLSGPMDAAPLERAIGEIVRRHDALRATFSTVDGRPAQVIAPPGAVVVPVVDVRDAPVNEREARAMELAAEDARRPFDLARGPLLRVSLFRLGVEEHILLVNVHHIACDGWSMGVFARELGTLYTACADGRPSPLPDLPIQYADYAAWQRDRLRDDALAERLAYWRARLAGAPTVLELPADHPRPTTGEAHGATHSIPLPTAILDALKRLSQDENATLYMTLLAAFQVLLHRYTGRDDLLVGSPIAGRTRVETEPLIGFFVNTLVLRGDLSGDPTFRALLARTRETALDAYAHQDLPFERLVAELQPPRDLGRNPLVQVIFALQNAPRADLQLAGLIAHPLRIDTGTAKFDLSLFVIETPEGARAAFEYNADLFDADTITRLSGHFHTLLEGVVADPDRPISALPLLTGAERHQLLVEWNDTRTDYPRDACVHELFAEQAARTPNAIAVVY